MKKLLFLLPFMAMSLSLNAQNATNVKRMEYEIGGGFNIGHKIYGVTGYGINLYFETRLNIENTPFDVGFQAMIAALSRYGDQYGYNHNIRHRGLMTTFVDYNYRHWKNLAIFAGLGLGMGAVNDSMSWKDPEYSYRQHDTVFGRPVIVNPRVGVELFNHLRITLEYKLMKRDYSFIGINIGGVFGGGYK